MRVVEKPWGREEIIEVNDHYCVKKLTMNPGCRCSYQYHEQKLETIHVIRGMLYITIEGQTLSYSPGDSVTIKPGVKHRMSAKAVEGVYLECSTPDLEDVVRVEDDFGRS